MQPEIVDKGPMLLLGLSFFGDPFQASAEWTEENEIGRLWTRFTAYLLAHGQRIQHLREPMVSYEVHIRTDETEHLGHFEIFTGVEVERLEDVPVDLLVKVIPAAQYAKFTLRGREITSDWPWEVSADWLPAAGYRMVQSFSFQRYDERFKGMDRVEESVLDVYIPVEPVEG